MVELPFQQMQTLNDRQNRALAHDLHDHAHGLLIDTILQDKKATQTSQAVSTNTQFAGGQA